MDFGKGKLMVDSAARLIEQTGQIKMWPTVNLYYSSIYFVQTDSISQYYLESVLPMLDALDPFDKSMALCSAGNIQTNLGNSSGGLEYYRRSLDAAQEIRPRNLNTEIGLHNNIAMVYYYVDKDTLAAISEYRKGLALITDSVEKTGENAEYLYYNLGRYFVDIAQPDSALRYIQKHAAMARARYSAAGMALLPDISLAQVALLKKQYRKADMLLAPFGHFIDTSNISAPQFADDYIFRYYEVLYQLKKAEGNYALALKALEEQRRFDVLTDRKKAGNQLKQSAKTLERKRVEIVLAEQEKKEANTRLLLFLIIFLLLLAIAIGLVVMFRNRKRLEERKLKELQQASIIEKKELLLQAENAERKRIAQEFHDELGGALTVIGMATQALKRLNIGAIAQTVDVLQRNNEKLTTQINEIVWSLNDKNDTLGSLLAYMRRYAEQFLSDAGLDYTINFAITKDELPVEGYQRRYLFQSVKESLHNIVKHSKATRVWCSAAIREATLTLTIEDNGKGMPPEASLIKGNGLDNMRNNIQALGGEVRWEQQAGTRVVIMVPLAEPG